MSTGLRISAVLSEAYRNLASGTSRAALMAAVLALTVGALAVADVREVIGVSEGGHAYVDAGAAVQIIESAGNVDGARCAALGGTRGIVAAAAVRQHSPLRAANLPASELTTWEVTPGMPALLAHAGGGTVPGEPPGDGGVWLSDDLADQLGSAVGGPFVTPTAATTVAGIYTWPDDGRARTLGYSLLSPVPAVGRFDQCWALVWPVDEETTSLLYTTLAPGTSTEANVGALNTTLGEGYDSATLLNNRLTRHAPLAAVVIGLTLGWTATRLRRLEIASALHARLPRVGIAWQHLLETTCWAAAAAVIAAAAVACAAVIHNPDPPMDTWLTGLRAVVAGCTTPLIGSLAAVAATREKHLFRYFRNR